MQKLIYILPFIIIIISTSYKITSSKTTPCEINLSYTLNFKGDSLKNKLIGLKWTLSYLGAKLPKGSFNKSISAINNKNFTINFDSIGFNEVSLSSLKELINNLKKTEEYRYKNSIDLGEFVTLTIGVSENYYNITRAKKTFTEFKKSYLFNDSLKFAVLNSTVAFHNRILYLSAEKTINKQAYYAIEGNGSVLDNSFVPEAFETFDIMENGQLRFAIFNSNGDLISASNPKLGNAGKPSKCIWCHEISLSPLFKETPDVLNYITKNEFTTIIKQRMAILNDYRQGLNSDIDFTKTQEHTQMELLYISYMEPSIERLSQEWNMPINTLKKLLNDKLSHKNEEFSFFGNLYHRNDNLKMAPYTLNKIPLSVREKIED